MCPTSISACRNSGTYVPRTEPADGAAGARAQAVDEIRFVPVPDPNTRVEGLVSGQFDLPMRCQWGFYDRVAISDEAEPVLLADFGFGHAVWAINHKQGPADRPQYPQGAASRAADGRHDVRGLRRRQVLQKRRRHVSPRLAGITSRGWSFTTRTTRKPQNIWKAAGYDGKPLRILTSRQYEFHFKMAEVAKMALEAAGFKVELNVVDWATLGPAQRPGAVGCLYLAFPFLPEPALTDLYNPDLAAGLEERGQGQGPDRVHHRNRCRQAAGAVRS